MIYETDIGPISLGIVNGVLLCEFGRLQFDQEPTNLLAKQVADYFVGKKIKRFSAEIPEGPSFTQRCWKACRSIPFGRTISYKELALMAGSPKAVRAAGQAMRRNPLAIITPCHRVLSSSGKLHGYAGKTALKSKELKRKQFLLDLEQGTMQL